jgi:hypothetical protein
MKKEEQVEKMLKLVERCENYIYKYLLTHDSIYIDRLFVHIERLKRMVQKLKAQ